MDYEVNYYDRLWWCTSRVVIRIRHVAILSQNVQHSLSLHQALSVVQEVVVVASAVHIQAVEAAVLVAHVVPLVVIDNI